MITATRLEAATAAVTVLSNRPEVTDWAQRYFGSWWNATDVGADTVSDADHAVIADVKLAAYEEITSLVHDGRPTEEVSYAKHSLLVARDGDDIMAASLEEEVAYRSTPSAGRLVLAGADVQPLALAASRLARESIRGQLLRDGWAVLHSSAVVRPDDGATLLTFGGKEPARPPPLFSSHRTAGSSSPTTGCWSGRPVSGTSRSCPGRLLPPSVSACSTRWAGTPPRASTWRLGEASIRLNTSL